MHKTYAPLAAVLVLLAASACAHADSLSASELSARLAAAKPGTTITLPAGEIDTPGIVLPAGVGLRGAGYGATTIKCSGQIGISVLGAGSSVSDLTVEGAANSGVQAAGASSVRISRVRAVLCLTGIMVSDSTGVRIENCVAAANRTGIVLNDCAKSDVVNCSMVGNTGLGASLGVNPASAFYNNLIANSPIGVYVSPVNTTLGVDNNFYLATAVGKCNDVQESNIALWRDSTGYDRHGLSMPLTFEAGPDPYVYRVTNTQAWEPDRAVTSGWGTSALAGFAAPDRDIDGNTYRFGPCIGAWESSIAAPRPPDGKFTVRRATGFTSAGLYMKSGRQVVWLFNNLPLRPGSYSYWLPSRDWEGKPVPPGDYQLRLAEADISFKVVGSGVGGNSGVKANTDSLCQLSNQQIAFDSKGRTVIAIGNSEGHINIRALGTDYKTDRWDFPGAANHIGFAIDGKGTLYSLRLKGSGASMLRLSEDTGDTEPFADGTYVHTYGANAFSATAGGMAILGDTLYLADAGANKVYFGPAINPNLTGEIDVPSPTSPVADPVRNLLWVLSAGKNVIAYDPTGAVKFQFPCPVDGAQSIAIAGNRFAVLSDSLGKVFEYDCSDPAHLARTITIGTGDGPYGQMQANRFAFQGLSPDTGLPRLAMDPSGNIGVVDTLGIKEFNPDGTERVYEYGGWFHELYVMPHEAGEVASVIDATTGETFRVDAATHTTYPGIQIEAPGGNACYFGEFIRNGIHYDLFRGNLHAPMPGQNVKFWRMTTFVGSVDQKTGKVTPLIGFSWWEDTTFRTDLQTPIGTDYDPAAWHTLTNRAGKPVVFPNAAEMVFDDKGDIVFDYGDRVYIYPLSGIDKSGIPTWDWDNPQTIQTVVDKDDTFTSPYDFKTLETMRSGPPLSFISFLPDGGFVRHPDLTTGHVTDLTGNWSGTDVACFNADGTFRWFQPLISYGGMNGGYACGKYIFGGHPTTSETLVFSDDGLLVADLGQPKGLPWGGKWLDNPIQYSPFIGNDGKTYMIYGDFNDCCFYWMSVEGLDNVLRDSLPVHIDAARSALLAAQPLPAPVKPPSPPVTQIKIVKLAGPMTIDGSLEKWRTAVPTPQAIITPESGSPDITGPADCSALVRYAHDGSDLYVQVIKFDDVIVFDQPYDSFYEQDGVEMGINGFMSGFKFDCTRTTDHGDILDRARFASALPSLLLDPDKAPRSIKTYDNAKDFPERRLIENLYGIDLTSSKVMVVEFKIPLDATTYQGDLASLPTTSPGSTIWLGMMIDDNDIPGGDVQKYEVWPSSYGTFNDKSTGAIATFE